MCFSATASFIAGGSLSALGVVTISKVKEPTEIPFAMIPLFFGVQQIIEGVIWLSFGNPILNMVMTYVFSMFSHVVWPVFIPLAVVLMERDQSRRKALYFFLLIGFLTGAYLLNFVIETPVTSEIVNNSIRYTSPHFYPGFVLMLYLMATCVSCLVSSHRMVNLFGIALFASFVVAFQA